METSSSSSSSSSSDEGQSIADYARDHQGDWPWKDEQGNDRDPAMDDEDHQGDWPWKDEQGNDRDPAMDDEAASYAADYSDAPRVY